MSNEGPTGNNTLPDVADLDSAKVLVVDDEQSVRETIRRFLELAGFQVTTAANGSAARDYIEEQEFDLIISDISMPEMDGMALLSEVRKRDLDLPVVLITGLPSLDTATRAVRHGAFQYMAKPFRWKDLIDTAVRATRLYRMAVLKRQALVMLNRMGIQMGDLASLGASLNTALDNLWVAYQPIVRASDGAVFGYEALMRSNEPALPHPQAILEAAEHLDRVHEIGRLMRRLAIQPFLEHRDERLLFINLHPQDLLDPLLFEPDSELAKIGERVVLEITERASLDRITDLSGTIDHLRRSGFRIALDDLGEGYSSLTSFAQLRPDFVKLDMSLVRGIDSDPLKRRLVASMTQICSELDMTVVAEGVETEAERRVIVELGCDLLQGFLMARPGLPFPEVAW